MKLREGSLTALSVPPGRALTVCRAVWRVWEGAGVTRGKEAGGGRDQDQKERGLLALDGGLLALGTAHHIETPQHRGRGQRGHGALIPST